MPMCHRSTIYFIGMQAREFYLAGRAIKDKFVAFNSKSRLLTWDILTGRMIDQAMIKEDYSDFEVY